MAEGEVSLTELDRGRNREGRLTGRELLVTFVLTKCYHIRKLLQLKIVLFSFITANGSCVIIHI